MSSDAAVTSRRIELLRWTDFGPEVFTRTGLAEDLGCPNGIAACLLCGNRIMIFDTALEDDALDGPSLILLHSIPGREYPNIICADCSDTTDWAVVLHVAQALGVGLFTTNVERGEPEC
jgi:hypothetical protein